jgi:biotin carboxylase
MLLTVEKLKDADWPRTSLTHFFTMNEGRTPLEILATVMGIARHHRIDRVVALDEFDLEAAALIREHMRLPGMGESATRFFRDKLAMRSRAQHAGIPVPAFTGVFFHHTCYDFMMANPGPWLLKPRTSASAIGLPSKN